jgi:hypothetical protein
MGRETEFFLENSVSLDSEAKFLFLICLGGTNTDEANCDTMGYVVRHLDGNYWLWRRW